jgi:hypothetical protein
MLPTNTFERVESSMKHLVAALALTLIGISTSSSAYAGPASDALGKCLVDSTTGRDRTEVVRWIFAAFSAHPDVGELSSVTAAQRDAITEEAARVFNRLLVVDCRAQTVAALRADGVDAVESAFEVLGKTAVEDMTTDPGVQHEMSKLAGDLDQDKLLALLAAGQENPR